MTRRVVTVLTDHARILNEAGRHREALQVLGTAREISDSSLGMLPTNGGKPTSPLVIRSCDIIVAMTNGGPGGHSIMPSYYIVDMYTNRRFIALGAAGSTVLLLIVAAFFVVIGIYNAVSRKRVS